MSDPLGDRGEGLLGVLLNRPYGRRCLPFLLRFLGSKSPVIDFMAQVAHAPPGPAPYFFVQVKSTRLGYTKREKRLKVSVSAQDMVGLSQFAAPAYVVGIDQEDEVGYIVSANGECVGGMPSLCTRFPIGRSTQEHLAEEVLAF